MIRIAALLLLAIFLNPCVGAVEPLPEEREALAAYLASSTCRDDLRKEIERQRQAWRNSDEDKDDIEDTLQILTYLQSELPSSGDSERERIRRHASIYRVLASLTLGEEKVRQLPPPNEVVRNVIWGSLFGHGIPIVPTELQANPSGKAANAESLFLHNPASDSYYDTSTLATMTPVQIAALDIGPGHPAWLSKGELSSGRGSRPNRVESSIEQGMAARLRGTGKLGDGSYSLASARKVLFLHKVSLSATSPKIETKDVYGVDWKLKWGDEPAVEPVSSRLYLMAGGRETDLVYANPPGRDGVTLILEDSEDVADEKDTDEEKHAGTLDQLFVALDELYGFDLEPYVHDSGTITAGNIDQVLALLPSGGEKKYRRDKLIGRTWVTFRESGSELKPGEVIYRLDGAPVEDPITAHDRVFRSVYLFDLWIQNGDVKEDNNKTYFRRDRSGDSIVALSEGHHDLGLSLGGLFSSGDLNKFHVGDRFAHEGEKKFRFRAPLIFKPEVWYLATWADGKWMARNIASIGSAEIRKAVSYSLWPDFVQETLVYRLVERRNTIATLFGETDRLDRSDIAAPTISFDVGSPAAVKALEQRYKLPAGAIDEAIASTGFPPGGRDVVVNAGKVTSCKVSPLIHALTKYRYPSGIAERYRRTKDKPPTCD